MPFNLNTPIIPGGHFIWKEYCLLQDWGKYTLPSKQQQINAEFLFKELDPIRREWGAPLVITSGARTKDYTMYLRNKRGIPAALGSAHNKWMAVDLHTETHSNSELWWFLKRRWAGRIEALHATPTWVHIDTLNWGLKQEFSP